MKITLRKVLHMISALRTLLHVVNLLRRGPILGADVRAARGLWGAFEDPGPPHLISRLLKRPTTILARDAHPHGWPPYFRR